MSDSGNLTGGLQTNSTEQINGNNSTTLANNIPSDVVMIGDSTIGITVVSIECIDHQTITTHTPTPDLSDISDVRIQADNPTEEVQGNMTSAPSLSTRQVPTISECSLNTCGCGCARSKINNYDA